MNTTMFINKKDIRGQVYYLPCDEIVKLMNFKSFVLVNERTSTGQ